MDFDTRYIRGLAAAVLGLATLALLGACGGSADTPLGVYIDRLQRSLDREIAPADRALAALPRARELRIELGTGTIDLLDLLALRGCELSVTIGKTNSSLGKLATASQRLLLELEFLTHAPACILQLERSGDAQLAETLREAAAEKRRQLAARIWNATLGGSEFREFWKRPLSLRDYPEDTGGEVPAALAELEQLVGRWQAGEFSAGQDRLEPILGIVRRGDGGSLLAALDAQRRALAAATAAVQSRTRRQPICFGGATSPRGTVVDTVVRKFFVGEVQPWSVSLARRQRSLGKPLAALEAALADVAPLPYRAWRDQREQVLASSSSAPKTHALALAELLETCGLRPGQAATGSA